jgi:hypothetical protein
MFMARIPPARRGRHHRTGATCSGLAILLPVVLAGCGWGAHGRASALEAELQQTRLQMQACLDAVWSNPAYAPLTVHLAKDANDITPLQLSDDKNLQDDEKPLFSQMYSGTAQCSQAEAEHAARAMPTTVLYLVERQNMIDDAALDLYQQRISWGEFNQRRKNAYESASPKIDAALLELKSWLPEPNDADLVQRQVAARVFMQYYQNQPIINAMN